MLGKSSPPDYPALIYAMKVYAVLLTKTKAPSAGRVAGGQGDGLRRQNENESKKQHKTYVSLIIDIYSTPPLDTQS